MPCSRDIKLVYTRFYSNMNYQLFSYSKRTSSTYNEKRYNELDIEMIPEHLYKCLYRQDDTTTLQRYSSLLELSKKHLNEQGIHYKRSNSKQSEHKNELQNLTIPELLGNNIVEHMEILGKISSQTYYEKASNIANIMLPKKPTEWNCSIKGWTRYSWNGTEHIQEQVNYPLEHDIIFDVEVAMTHHPYPILAVAASTFAWYSWCSIDLVHFNKGSTLNPTPELISLGDSTQERLVIGHSISFDRIRVKEEYSIQGTKFRYLDTQSLHSAVSSLSNIQMNEYKSNKDGDELWRQVGCGNSLKDCVALHCNIKDVDKEPREILISGSISNVQENAQLLMNYCAMDVEYTHILFKALWKKYLLKCPSPVTFAGNLILSTCYLPTDTRWNDFLRSSDDYMNQAIESIHTELSQLAIETAEKYRDEYEKDPWLRMLDWTPVPAKYTKGKMNKKTQAIIEEPRPIGQPLLFGKPAWLKKLYDSKTSTFKVTTKTNIVPYLLRLKYKGNPVHHIQNHGWCFLDDSVNHEIIKQSKDHIIPIKAVSHESNEIIYDKGFAFKRIPHPDLNDGNVGNLLSKSCLIWHQNETITSDVKMTEKVTNINITCSFWTSYRERARNQLLITEDLLGMPLGFEARDDGNENTKPAVILPQLVTMGTVTRRAVEPLWLTASNSKPNLIGSELKSRITAPKGYCIVGADVDSQELWLASLFGDAQLGQHGSTAFGWMTLAGSKTMGTDLHSRSASLLGINRDHAKILNYGRIYGAGIAHATQLLQKFNPNMNLEKVETKAKSLYKETKGQRTRLSKNEDSNLDTLFEWYYIDCIENPKTSISFYQGGTESLMFNELERIAKSNNPRTPALESTISDALLSKNLGHGHGNEYMTSRVNWIVQSTGADYLHLLLSSMEYLIRLYKIQARFCISIHDEVRYIVKEQDKYRAALALQISNIWTRAFISAKMGLMDLPLSIAFFSGIDIDIALRKEVNLPCITPSNPTIIPNGQSLDIHQLIQVFHPNIPELGKCDENFLRNVKIIEESVKKERQGRYVLPNNMGDLQFMQRKKWIELQMKKKRSI